MSASSSIYSEKVTIDDPKVFLVSYPRSGNTMIRSYLSTVLNIQRYSVYEGDGVYFDPTNSEADWNQVQVIKDHSFRKEYRNVIFVVRDGRDATLSLVYYTFLSGMHNFTKSSELHSLIKAFKYGYTYGFWGDYVKHAVAMANNPRKNVLFVRYEDFITDAYAQLVRIADFLKLEVVSDAFENAIQIASQDKGYQAWNGWGFDYTPDKESLFYQLTRNRGYSNWRAIFDNEARAAFHNSGGTEMLMHFDYETDRDWWIAGESQCKPEL